jgi:CubicO group peptidase (beta-lactamase class C family)
MTLAKNEDRLGVQAEEEAGKAMFKRKICSCLSVLGLLFSSCAVARTAANDDKAASGADEIFADLTKPGSPGCALGVYRDGKIIYAKGYGLANIEENVPITPQAVFDIGSTSKQFSATSILLLEKQGKLSVNDDVRKYIPELPDYGPRITILNLLNHTSGLRDYLTLMELAGYNIDGVTTDDEALALVTRQKALNFAPGSEWLYSNTGFFLLSVIVKRVSGKTLREFAGENIFSPLNMSHTQYRDDHASLIPNRALAYDEKENKQGYALNVSYFEQTGDGAVHTSIEDLQKWDENFYSAQIGGRDFLREIQEQGKLNNGKVLDYAKGLFLTNYRGLPTVSHGGAWGGYRAELLRFPAQHFSVACLCNLSNAGPTRRAHQVADIYLAAVMKPKENKKESGDEERKEKAEISLAAGQLEPYIGEYHSEELGVSYKLGIVDGRIKIVSVLDGSGLPRANNFSTEMLRATGTSEFQLGKTGVTLRFTEQAQHKISGFVMDAGRTKDLVFTRKEVSGN